MVESNVELIVDEDETSVALGSITVAMDEVGAVLQGHLQVLWALLVL